MAMKDQKESSELHFSKIFTQLANELLQI